MDLPDGPQFSSQRVGDSVRLSLGGHWTVDASAAIEARADGLLKESAGARRVIFDLGRIVRLDTAGAWLIDRARDSLGAAGVEATLESIRPEYEILLREARYRAVAVPTASNGSYIVRLLADIGETVVSAGADMYNGVSFLGQVVTAIGRSLVSPSHFRGTSLVVQMESIAPRGAPIIALINFLAGAIIAQQGIFQLRRFGATIFVVDLIGILVLRELGVLLTAIMISGAVGLGDHRRTRLDEVTGGDRRPDRHGIAASRHLDRSPNPGAHNRPSALDVHRGYGRNIRRPVGRLGV